MCTSPSEATSCHCSSTSGRSVVFTLAAGRCGQCSCPLRAATGPDVRASGERDAGAGSAAAGAFAFVFVESPNGELMVVGQQGQLGFVISRRPKSYTASFARRGVVRLLEEAEFADNKETVLGFDYVRASSGMNWTRSRTGPSVYSREMGVGREVHRWSDETPRFMYVCTGREEM